MICKNCHEAFNGSTGICHLCGTVHGDLHAVPDVVDDVQIDDDPVVPEATRPSKKKKSVNK